MEKEKINISVLVFAPIEKIWSYWTTPQHIEKWNNASPEWHTPKAINNLGVGGQFIYTMAAKDGSISFDFSGVYNAVITNKTINYTMDDNRNAWINFEEKEDGVLITEIFEAENENPIELQQFGWQAILDKFKAYTESN
jgi:uncharacterized protein YndB with AHSA1/START domain